MRLSLANRIKEKLDQAWTAGEPRDWPIPVSKDDLERIVDELAELAFLRLRKRREDNND